MSDPRRSLPSVSALLELPALRELLESHPRSVVVEAARSVLREQRAMRETAAPEVGWAELVHAAVRAIERRSLRPVINATGIVLHTNLGRAPLAAVAIEAVAEVAAGFSNLEYDLDNAGRGSRHVHCVSLIRELTGSEDAIVVNNCASALVLALSALARGREVIVSRGELVEIGGSFRVPEIMSRSGAAIIEIGTTNRTHIEDYARAVSPRTGAIAKIHRSNFAMTGFVADVNVRQLVPIAAEHGIPIIHDLGSGLLMALDEFGLSGEPTASDALGEGAALVLMSGDKLLGGPQAGIIAGAASLIGRLRKDPFARAMRVDKMTIAALTATLELYRDRERALREIPTLAMISAPVQGIRQRAAAIASALQARGISADVVDSSGAVGAGAFPTTELPSAAVAIRRDVVSAERRLKTGDPAVIGRITDDVLLLDLRSVLPETDQALLGAVTRALT